MGIITSTMAGRSLLSRFKEGHNLSSKDFVREIQQDPEAASEICAQSGNTLLHYICCGGDAPLKVVSALLTAYPEAAATCDHDGNIPLVGAISNGCGKQVVELLLQANPEGIRWTSGGHTLLHFAACNNAGLDVVQLLLDTWPEATKERDDEGNTPPLRSSLPSGTRCRLCAGRCVSRSCSTYRKDATAPSQSMSAMQGTPAVIQNH